MDWDLIPAIDRRGISTISQANANCGFPPITAGGTAFMSALEK